MIIGNEATKKLLDGVNLVANAVKGTLGPAAKTAVIQRDGKFPIIVNDGVSIAKAVSSPDPYTQLGVSLIQQVADEAQTKSGDGTTTATILAQALCNLGFALINDEESEWYNNPTQLTQDIRADSEIIIEKILDHKVECKGDMIKQVATIAANNDEELGALIAEVMESIGKEGVVSVEVGGGFDTTYEIINGYEILSGAISPHFPTQLKEANVLLVSDKINSFDSLIPALEASIESERPLLIISHEVSNTVLPNLLVNVMQGKVDASIIRVPGMRSEPEETLRDIAASCGGTVIGKLFDTKLRDVTEADFGYAETVEINNDNTVLTTEDSPSEDYLDRLYQTLHDLEKQTDNAWAVEAMQRRIARLQQGVAAIKVGGRTEVELLERKERVDDAVNAVKAAMQNGVIPGGGILMDYYSGYNKTPVVNTAFKIPKFTIQENAGYEASLSSDCVMGLNSVTGEWVNMLEAGIIDPVDVTINSIRSAVSVATLVLGSNCLIPTT
tara:strand:+ start:3785 stop:5284 length:1500 start_codon:yes stop_codon:yes gene_type:complete